MTIFPSHSTAVSGLNFLNMDAADSMMQVACFQVYNQEGKWAVLDLSYVSACGIL
jgi:hypothetical protein